MTLEDDFMPLVVPYVPGCPPQTILAHLLQAAKVFCRRTLAWNVSLAAMPTAITQIGTVGRAQGNLALSSYFFSYSAPITYTVLSGALPAGLTLNAATGSIAGTPTTHGEFLALIRATDALGNTADSSPVVWSIASSIANVTFSKASSATANCTLALPADTELVKLLGCEIKDGATYTVQNGALGRKFVREAAGRNVCVLALPNTITIYPAPPVSGRDLVVDVAVMPSNDAAVWPDTMAEHIEYIAAGAVGSLCAMPKSVGWRDIDTAADQRDRFERRINAVYHTTARTLVRAEAARQSVQF